MAKSLNLMLLVSLVFFSACTGTGSEKSSTGTKENKAKQCMEKALAFDEEAGKKRNHACEKVSLSQTIKDYIKTLEEIDYSDCTAEFEAAFKDHMKAWESILTITDNYPDLRGELHDLFEQIGEGPDGEAFKKLVEGIWDTWEVVEAQMK